MCHVAVGHMSTGESQHQIKTHERGVILFLLGVRYKTRWQRIAVWFSKLDSVGRLRVSDYTLPVWNPVSLRFYT